MKKTFIALLALMIMGFSACNNDEEVPDCYIEVENESSITLEQITFYMGNRTENYGDLVAGETTEKVLFSKRYVADSITLTANGHALVAYPNDGLINWLPIEGGATYTYLLNVEMEEHLAFEIEKDED